MSSYTCVYAWYDVVHSIVRTDFVASPWFLEILISACFLLGSYISSFLNFKILNAFSFVHPHNTFKLVNES